MNLDAIAEIISQGLGGEPEDVLDAYDDGSGGVEGQFFDRGLVYDYEINNDGLTYQENRADSDYIHAYFQGQLEAQGIRCDSDNAYEFYMGYQGVERNDDAKMNCQFGQCGGRCLKRGEKCRLTERLAGAANKVKGEIKSRNAAWNALTPQERMKKKVVGGAKTGATIGASYGALVGGAPGIAVGGALGGALGGAEGYIKQGRREQRKATREAFAEGRKRLQKRKKN